MNAGVEPARVGLVLGAGGVVGGAWLAGALAALAHETGWEPSHASHLVGTSAGSVAVAMLAAGVRARKLMPGARGWPLAELAGANAYPPQGRLAPLPGSWRMSATALARRPTGFSLLRAFSGLVPCGRVSTAAIERTVRNVVPAGWTAHPRCWVVATDYQSGGRVVFGAEGAPPAGLAEAAAASCAIPGFFRPVRIGGRSYVDGGLHSLSNLDLLAGQGLDLVVCLSPLSIRSGDRGEGPDAFFATLVSRLAAAELDREAALVRARGTPVLVLEPTAADARVMGPDMMVTDRCEAVALSAARSAAAALRAAPPSELPGRLRRAA